MEEIYNVIKVKQELEQKTKKSANCNQTDDKKYLFQTEKNVTSISLSSLPIFIVNLMNF
jgi:hypothetical protein